MATLSEPIVSPAVQRTPPGWLIPLALAIITFAVFLPTLNFDFVYDDYAQIVETKQLNSVHMIPRYFTGHVWQWKTPNEKGPYYRPIFLLWLLLNQTLFGLSPAYWHLTNVLTHVAATVLLYYLARRLTEDSFASAIAALIFGLHPAHVESVDWVSGITDPLMAVFVFGSLLLFLKRQITASLVLYAVALLEKETAIVVPALVLGLAYWFPARTADTSASTSAGQRLRAALIAFAPYLFLTIAYLGLRLAVMHQLTLVITPIPLRQVLFTWPSMVLFYLRHLVLPTGLSVFYTYHTVTTPDLYNFWIPLLIIAITAAVLLFAAFRSRVAAFAVLLFALPLLPALNIRSFARVELVHDRYLYLPIAGFAILVALLIRRLRLGSPRILGVPALQCAVVLLLGAAFAYGTVDQGQYWLDNVSLFERGVQIAPNNEIANQCLGTALLLRNNIPDAVPYYKHALALNPNMIEAQYSLGRCYYELNMFQESEPYFLNALRINSAYSMPALYYGLAKYREGDYATAEKSLRYAMAVRGPDEYREYHLSLGMILEAKGDLQGAQHEYEAEMRENPDPTKALDHLRALRTRMSSGT